MTGWHAEELIGCVDRARFPRQTEDDRATVATGSYRSPAASFPSLGRRAVGLATVPTTPPAAAAENDHFPTRRWLLPAPRRRRQCSTRCLVSTLSGPPERQELGFEGRREHAAAVPAVLLVATAVRGTAGRLRFQDHSLLILTHTGLSHSL